MIYKGFWKEMWFFDRVEKSKLMGKIKKRHINCASTLVISLVNQTLPVPHQLVLL